MIVLARLGIWQLDRLAQRRASNAVIAASLETPPFDLNNTPIPLDLSSWENRLVDASGSFDYDRQILLKVQNWDSRAGVHLITPLVMDDGQKAVLVDNGWIPDAERGVEARSAYDVPGEVTIDGYIALSQALSRGSAATPEGPQDEVYRVDIAEIQQQLPYELLPFYIIQSPVDNNAALPYRLERQIDLSEGPHLSYAVQWFIFSIGLGVAYLLFVRKNNQRSD